MIELIEIQITNECNRACIWCPPYTTNKENKNRKTLINFKSLVKLRKFYKKNKNYFSDNLVINIGRYGEPLTSFKYVAHIANFIKRNFDCILTLNTNGDLLLDGKGNNSYVLDYFDFVFVSRYDDNEYFNIALKNVFKIFNNKINKLNIKKYKNVILIKYSNTNVLYRYKYHNRMVFTSRGNLLNIGSVNPDTNNVMCQLLGKCLMIDYNSNILPCCEVSSMNEEHSSMICENILTDNLFSILNKMNNLTNIDNYICENCAVNPDLILSLPEIDYE